MQRLNYIWPAGEVVTTSVDPETPMYTSWLHSMVETNPDIIFFYTVDSTDIFEEELSTDVQDTQHVDEIRLSTKSDAQRVLNHLRNIIVWRGDARVSDLYSLVGLQDQVTYIDNLWGWKDLSSASIAVTIFSGEGVMYRLDLPVPHRIR